MPLYETIVCAVDFSDHSRRALRLAWQIAERVGANLQAVHVIDFLLSEAAAAAYDVQRLEADAGAELRAFVDQAVPGGRVATSIRTGRADDQVLAFARERAADLIAMGTQGLGGVRRVLFGSVAARLLRSVSVPVMAVACRQEVSGPEPPVGAVAAALDLAESSGAVAAHAASLAEALKVPLTLVHAIPHGPLAPYAVDRHDQAAAALRSRAEQQLEAAALPFAGRVLIATEVRLGPPAEQIAAAVGTLTNPLVVIGLGGGGLLHRPGSTAYHVLSLSESPVLAVPS